MTYTNYDRDEDGEPGFAEEQEIERFTDYLSELTPEEQKQAIRAKAKREAMELFEREYDEEEAYNAECQEKEIDPVLSRQFDREDRATRRAEGGW